MTRFSEWIVSLGFAKKSKETRNKHISVIRIKHEINTKQTPTHSSLFRSQDGLLLAPFVKKFET